jgi:hypothetical protein
VLDAATFEDGTMYRNQPENAMRKPFDHQVERYPARVGMG